MTRWILRATVLLLALLLPYLMYPTLCARTRLSRIARSACPNGEATARAAIQNPSAMIASAK